MVELYVSYWNGKFFISNFKSEEDGMYFFENNKEKYRDFVGEKYGFPYATPFFVECKTSEAMNDFSVETSENWNFTAEYLPLDDEIYEVMYSSDMILGFAFYDSVSGNWFNQLDGSVIPVIAWRRK